MKLIFETQKRTKTSDNWFGSTWNFWFFWIPSSRIQVIKIESSEEVCVFHMTFFRHMRSLDQLIIGNTHPTLMTKKFKWFFSHAKAYYSDANEGGRYKPLGRFSKSCWEIVCNQLKWCAATRWLSSSYCLMRKSDQMTIGKTLPIFKNHRFWKSWKYSM